MSLVSMVYASSENALQPESKVIMHRETFEKTMTAYQITSKFKESKVPLTIECVRSLREIHNILTTKRNIMTKWYDGMIKVNSGTMETPKVNMAPCDFHIRSYMKFMIRSEIDYRNRYEGGKNDIKVVEDATESRIQARLAVIRTLGIINQLVQKTTRVSTADLIQLFTIECQIENKLANDGDYGKLANFFHQTTPASFKENLEVMRGLESFYEPSVCITHLSEKYGVNGMMSDVFQKMKNIMKIKENIDEKYSFRD